MALIQKPLIVNRQTWWRISWRYARCDLNYCRTAYIGAAIVIDQDRRCHMPDASRAGQKYRPARLPMTEPDGPRLLPQHDQRVDAVGHLAPLRVVVSLEVPGLALVREQQQFAPLQSPHGGRKALHHRIAAWFQEDLKIILPGVVVGE